jgi:hypothetical protein
MPDPQNIKYRSELHLLLPPNFVSCEVGVAEGYFSADILSWGASLHYMVDAWKHFEGQTGDGGFNQAWHDNNYVAACARVAKYDGKVKILRGASVEMASEIPDNSLDLCYVDAWHTYDGTMSDARAYWPKLKEGGIMAFHDYLNEDYGVKRAVDAWSDHKRVRVNVIPEDHEPDAGAWIRKPLRQANPQPRQAQTQSDAPDGLMRDDTSPPLVAGFYRWRYTNERGEDHRSWLGEVFPTRDRRLLSSAEFMTYARLLTRVKDRLRSQFSNAPQLPIEVALTATEVSLIELSGHSAAAKDEIIKRLTEEIPRFWAELGGAPEMHF